MTTAWTSGFSLKRATLENDWDDLSRLRFRAEERVRAMGHGTDVARGLDRMATYEREEQLYALRDRSGLLVACYALTPAADPAFWDAEERQADALYLDSAIVDPGHAHRGLGRVITFRACEQARAVPVKLLRLDCQRIPRLRAHWESLGFTHLRDVEVPGRMSGTLMERKI